MNTHPFTADAKRRWDKIPEWGQTEILNNIFCGKCLKAVTIDLETAKMWKDALVLRGKCKTCGQEVCRVVESEND
jgi:hypothetical protein